ncbi:MAG: alkaline phosphatase [Muribaculaceae bacterium]|nr:alkaline phosphatase [Muribaculaceae bacterium]
MKKFRTIISAFLIAAAIPATCAADDNSQDGARYIFYFIGDGMGMGPVMAAQNYNRTILGNESPLTMMRMPVVAWCQTYSFSSPVTDSAAAGTALATGTKTRNGMLGMGPDTTAVTSIASELHDRGYGIGLVTTVAADDATPGAFYAHVPSRKMSYEIDIQGAESGYEYIAGASYGGFNDKDGNPTDLRQRIDEAGIELLYGASALGEHSARRVMLFGDETAQPWDVSYTIDSVAGALTLPAMTADCLAHLQKYTPDRFFMMVEGGNIDHALHANDGGAAIKEVLNFDQALAMAFDFYRQHPDETLIVVTADHDTGGFALGSNYLGYNNKLEVFDHQRVSKEAFSDYCKSILKSRRIYTWDDMKEYLADKLGLFGALEVSPEREQQLKEMFDITFEQRNSHDQKTLYANFNQFAVEVFRTLNDLAGVGFTTTHHSGNPVPLFAVGAGADVFKGFNNNSELPGKILELAR